MSLFIILRILFFVSNVVYAEVDGGLELRIAVLEFQGDDINTPLLSHLSDSARAGLADARSDRIDLQRMYVLGRESIHTYLDDHGLDVSSLVGTEVEKGRALGVDYVLLGHITKENDTYTVHMSMISTFTGKTVFESKLVETSAIQLLERVNITVQSQVVQHFHPVQHLGLLRIKTKLDDDEEWDAYDKDDEDVIYETLENSVLAKKYNHLKIISTTNHEQYLKEKGISKDEVSQAKDDLGVGRILGFDYVLTGSVVKIEDSYIFQLTMHDVRTGSLLESKSITAGSVEELLNRLKIASKEIIEDNLFTDKADTRGSRSISQKKEELNTVYGKSYAVVIGIDGYHPTIGGSKVLFAMHSR